MQNSSRFSSNSTSKSRGTCVSRAMCYTLSACHVVENDTSIERGALPNFQVEGNYIPRAPALFLESASRKTRWFFDAKLVLAQVKRKERARARSPGLRLPKVPRNGYTSRIWYILMMQDAPRNKLVHALRPKALGSLYPGRGGRSKVLVCGWSLGVPHSVMS